MPDALGQATPLLHLLRLDPWAFSPPASPHERQSASPTEGGRPRGRLVPGFGVTLTQRGLLARTQHMQASR